MSKRLATFGRARLKKGAVICHNQLEVMGGRVEFRRRVEGEELNSGFNICLKVQHAVHCSAYLGVTSGYLSHLLSTPSSLAFSSVLYHQ